MSAPTGFLLAEDAAVKSFFSNIRLRDDRNNERKVQVFFRHPESETERQYPFITIENIDIVHARQRQHSETTLYSPRSTAASASSPNNLTYWPDERSTMTSASAGLYYTSGDHVPLDMLYQISTFARSALHDRQLTSIIMKLKVPFRYGFIGVEADNTIRRFDLLDWISADLLDPESGYRKRIFRKIYTIQMSAELPSTEYTTIRRVSTVNGSLTGSFDQRSSRTPTPATITEAF